VLGVVLSAVVGLTDVGREVLGFSLVGLTDVGDEVVGSLLGIAVVGLIDVGADVLLGGKFGIAAVGVEVIGAVLLWLEDVGAVLGLLAVGFCMRFT